MSVDYTEVGNKQQARMNQVLDAASYCFVEHGFHAAGMAKIAQKAKMSPGHIYHYFKNKDAIIQALVQREGDRAIEHIDSIQAHVTENIIETLIAETEESVKEKINPFQSRLNLEILAESQRNPEVGRIVKENDMRIHKRFVEMLGSRLDFPDVDFAVDILMTIFLGVTSRYVRNPDMQPEQARKILNYLMRSTLQGMH
jgi:AcrR family transcriptional regulator